jgi:hypothetical protein
MSSQTPIIIGTIIGMIIGFGISGGAIFYFWNRGKSAPKDVLERFAEVHGLRLNKHLDHRAEASGLLRNLHTEIAVILGEPPELQAKIRLPQGLPVAFRVETHPYERGGTFRSCFKVTPEADPEVEAILTDRVQRALVELARAATTVSMNDDEIRWTGPGTITDVKKLPAMQARVQGVVMALGQRSLDAH